MAGADVVNPMLLMMLSASVPLRIQQLLTHPHRNSIQRHWAERAADEVASHSDDLMFGGPKRGNTAAVFNRLAEGLAALALCPGGVLFTGLHWCTEHQVGIQCTDPAELACTHARPEKATTERDRLRDAAVVLSARLNNPVQLSLFDGEAS
jgi:hypothetical protein